MMAQVDDGHLDQPGSIKRVKIDMEDHPSDDEEFNEDQNPFQVQVIMNVFMKLVSSDTGELMKYRLVSSLWNAVGGAELGRRSEKPIKFESIEELQDDDKLGELIRLKNHHHKVFPVDQHYIQGLFSNFSFFVKTLTSPQIDQLNTHFTPKCVEFYGDLNGTVLDYPRTSAGLEQARAALEVEFHFPTLSKCLSKFLIQISPFVQEIEYTNFHFSFANSDKRVDEDIVQELTSTKFPKLIRITNDISYDNLTKMFFFPIIGQNSPKLRSLKLGTDFEKYRPIENIKEKFESSGLLSKLKTLNITDLKGKILQILTEFGERGLLKLTTLVYKDIESVQVKKVFAQFLASQGDSLKILNITTFSRDLKPPPPPADLIPFPSLPNLLFLYIDYFTSFEPYYEPIDFTLQLPKLGEIRTHDMATFLDVELGQGEGSLVKTVAIIPAAPNPHDDDEYSEEVDYEKLHEIFPNLEFLAVHFAILQIISDEYQNLPLWSQLRKITLHCHLDALRECQDHVFSAEGLIKLLTCLYGNLKDVKEVEIVVFCGHKLMDDDLYWKHLAATMKRKILDHYSRLKYYKKYLDHIYECLSPITSLTLTFDGYRICENFKRDIRATLPGRDCVFICSYFSNYLPSMDDD